MPLLSGRVIPHLPLPLLKLQELSEDVVDHRSPLDADELLRAAVRACR
jgi:hypothetical protein